MAATRCCSAHSPAGSDEFWRKIQDPSVLPTWSLRTAAKVVRTQLPRRIYPAGPFNAADFKQGETQFATQIALGLDGKVTRC